MPLPHVKIAAGTVPAHVPDREGFSHAVVSPQAHRKRAPTKKTGVGPMMSSLYVGATGLVSLGEGMSSISNNIANTNTVAFKSAMMLYQDLTSASVCASSNSITNLSQRGLGVSVETNRTMFQQGSLMAGSDVTDIAITGKGYFGVEKNGVTEYTRAGNFRFTKDGDLIDPSGFSLLANKITNGVVSGTATPVKIDFSTSGQGYMKPKATTAVTLIENLGMTTAKTTDAANQFFSLAAAWNGTVDPPLSSSQYGYADTLPIYDAEGALQTLNAYYDYVGTFDGKKVYQYVLGTAPDADGANAGTQGAGLFAAGTITFTSTGEIADMTMFTPPSGGGTANLSAWVPASFGENGNPSFSAVFAGKNGALPAQNITLDFGLQMNGSWSNSYTSAADVNANPAALYTGASRSASAAHSTSFSGSSGSLSFNQNGYAEGHLTSLNIDGDGYMIGNYSNGQSDELYRIPLYRFTSEDNLRREGGNHFSAPDAAGNIESGFPQTENYGSLAELSLEQSNVDLAKEFTSMIITQRGFQMNSKVITTSDAMLQRALELKR